MTRPFDPKLTRQDKDQKVRIEMWAKKMADAIDLEPGPKKPQDRKKKKPPMSAKKKKVLQEMKEALLPEDGKDQKDRIQRILETASQAGQPSFRTSGAFRTVHNSVRNFAQEMDDLKNLISVASSEISALRHEVSRLTAEVAQLRSGRDSGYYQVYGTGTNTDAFKIVGEK